MVQGQRGVSQPRSVAQPRRVSVPYAFRQRSAERSRDRRTPAPGDLHDVPRSPTSFFTLCFTNRILTVRYVLYI